MKKIGILVVAYNAATTLAKVLDRIPREFRPLVHDVLVFDDSSSDATYLVGLGYGALDPQLPLTVLRHRANLGYGGNQKSGYRWALEHDLDFIVLLHGDGQYAPELLPAMVEPLERGEADAVFGSRMMVEGGARAGGMPLYKFVGNKVLTAFDNAMVGTELTEWHSGYRAYRVAALRDIAFESNSDGFDFDTEIIIQLHDAGKRIVEIPIPTYYGDEISYVNGMKYARDTAQEVLRYRLQRVGFGRGGAAVDAAPRDPERLLDSSDARLLAWLRALPPGRVLHLGCLDGSLSASVRELGHRVTGVEVEEFEGARANLDDLVVADLDDGIPPEVTGPFDVVLAVDVVTRVRRPEALLADSHRVLAPGGTVMLCAANFGHWYARARVGLGAFDYDQRGILDRRHIRFFTRRGLERLFRAAGLRTLRREAVGAPFEALRRGGSPARQPPGRLLRNFERVERLGVALRPTLFAFQLLYQLVPEGNGDSGSGRPTQGLSGTTGADYAP